LCCTASAGSSKGPSIQSISFALRNGVVSANLGQVLTGILSKSDDELLHQERALLARLQVALARFDAAPEQQLTLERSIAQLDELFLLVIVGEFNSGKSAFINALVGSRVVEEGVTPTTAQINILQYGDMVERQVRGPA